MILSGFPLSSLIFWATHIVRQPYKFVIWHAWSQSQSKFLLQISQRKIMAAYSEVPTEPEGTQHQEQENQLAQGPLWALLCFCGLMCCRGSLLQTEICTPKNIHSVNTLLVTPVKWKRSLCHLSREEGCGVLYSIAGHTFMKWCNRMEITAMYAEANSLHQLASLLPVPHFTWSLL